MNGASGDGCSGRAAPNKVAQSPATSTLVLHWQTHWTSFVALVLEVAALAWYLRSVRRLAGREPVVVAVQDGGLRGRARRRRLCRGGRPGLLRRLQLHRLGHPAPLAHHRGPAPVGYGRSRSPWPCNRRPRVPRRPCSKSSGGHRRVCSPTPWWPFAGLMGTMYVYFLTPLYGFSERHPVLQAYLLLHFLLAGCLFWWPMVGKDLLPRRFGFGTRFVLVFVSVPFNAVLGPSHRRRGAAAVPGGQYPGRHPVGWQRPVGLARSVHGGRSGPVVRAVGARGGAQSRSSRPPARCRPGRRPSLGGAPSADHRAAP